MNLYLLEQTEHEGYDTFDSVVVAAEDADEARLILPSPGYSWGEESSTTWASKPENVTVLYLGVAADGTKAGVILASFNAG